MQTSKNKKLFTDASHAKLWWIDKDLLRCNSTSRRDACEMADGDAAGVLTIHTVEGVVRRTAFHDHLRAERDNLEAEGTALQPEVTNVVVCRYVFVC